MDVIDARAALCDKEDEMSEVEQRLAALRWWENAVKRAACTSACPTPPLPCHAGGSPAARVERAVLEQQLASVQLDLASLKREHNEAREQHDAAAEAAALAGAGLAAAQRVLQEVESQARLRRARTEARARALEYDEARAAVLRQDVERAEAQLAKELQSCEVAQRLRDVALCRAQVEEEWQDQLLRLHD